jgi:acetyl esterase/lipase
VICKPAIYFALPRIVPVLAWAVLAAGLAAQTPPAFKVPADIIWEPDLEYSIAGGKGARLAMDVVRPAEGGGPCPAVVCIHGGGFRAGNREHYLPLCVRLAQRGYVAATVSYRLAPLYQFPAPLEDIKTAIRWLRANATHFGIDPERIGVTGESAGGHLALFAGLTGDVREFEGPGPNLDQSSKVSCVVNYYGPTDFTKSYGKSVDAAEVLPLFLGGDLEHERPEHIRASPLNWVSPRAAPVLTIHGTADRYVAYEQAVWLTDRLRAAGVEAELETLEGAGHGFQGQDAERAERRMLAFFDRYLLPKQNERELVISDHGPARELLGISWPSGRILWRTPNAGGRDVQALPDGHVLYTMDVTRRVVEIGRNLRVVWTYGAAEGLQVPVAAQRLRNGNTLIGDSQQGKLIEVDRAGRTVWTYQSPDIGGMRMRNCRRVETGDSAGNTLIAVEAAGKVIEISPAGQVLWTFEAQGGARRAPYQALRLTNGNTMIGLADPGEVLEVDRSGKLLRAIGGNNMDVRLGWVTGIEPLAGGGLLIADYTGRRIVEVDSAGHVVHQWRTGARDIASISLAPK